MVWHSANLELVMFGSVGCDAEVLLLVEKHCLVTPLKQCEMLCK